MLAHNAALERLDQVTANRRVTVESPLQRLFAGGSSRKMPKLNAISKTQ